MFFFAVQSRRSHLATESCKNMRDGCENMRKIYRNSCFSCLVISQLLFMFPPAETMGLRFFS